MKTEFNQRLIKDVNGNLVVLCNETEQAEGCKLSVKSERYDFAQAFWIDASCQNGFSGEEGIVLSLPTEETDGFLAIENHSDFWCRPFFGKNLRDIPRRTQMLLFHTRQDTYKLYLPVCADTYKTVLRGNADGFEAVTFSNCDGLLECNDQLALITAEGNDPYTLIETCTALAAKLLGNGLLLRKDRKMPKDLEYLGWCSWDALQFRISHEGLLEKVKEFREKNVPIRFAILDDMWADVPDLKTVTEDATFREMVNIMHQSRIRTFDGAPERFPKGMAAAIADIKEMGIPKIGLWYPTTGYWKGFYDDCDLVAEHPELFIAANPGRWHKEGEKITLVNPDRATEFFDLLASKAKEWGIDFIKVDNQGYHKHYKNLYPVGQSARAVQKAIDASAENHFDGEMINCMGMPSECMFNRPTTAISRCSDDFMPESKEWFTKNILQCAYNGLLQGQYYINDWDMFWTDDEQATKNSVCRAISGGPIYVSDKIGRTRPEILLPLALEDGRILRPDNSAVPTKDCLTADPSHSGKPLKIYNSAGDSALIAAFHIDADAASVSGTISAVDARLANGAYAYYEYFTGDCGVLQAGESLPFTLKDRDTFRLFTLVPLKKNGITLLGRCDKFIGIKAIEKIEGDTVTLAEGGKVGFYADRNVRVFCNEKELEVHKNGALCYVTTERNETVLRFC